MTIMRQKLTMSERQNASLQYRLGANVQLLARRDEGFHRITQLVETAKQTVLATHDDFIERGRCVEERQHCEVDEVVKSAAEASGAPTIRERDLMKLKHWSEHDIVMLGEKLQIAEQRHAAPKSLVDMLRRRVASGDEELKEIATSAEAETETGETWKQEASTLRDRLAEMADIVVKEKNNTAGYRRQLAQLQQVSTEAAARAADRDREIALLEERFEQMHAHASALELDAQDEIAKLQSQGAEQEERLESIKNYAAMRIAAAEAGAAEAGAAEAQLSAAALAMTSRGERREAILCFEQLLQEEVAVRVAAASALRRAGVDVEDLHRRHGNGVSANNTRVSAYIPTSDSAAQLGRQHPFTLPIAEGGTDASWRPRCSPFVPG